MCKLEEGDYNKSCTSKPYKGCSDCNSYDNGYQCNVYDDDNGRIAWLSECAELYNLDSCERYSLYNEKGSIIFNKNTYYGDGWTNKHISKKNDNGVEIFSGDYCASASEESCTIRKYYNDTTGKLELYYKYADDRVTLKEKKEYNSNGDITMSTIYNADGVTPSSITEKQYNNGTLYIEKQTKYSNGVASYDEYTYNTDGKTKLYKLEACTEAGTCHHQDTYNEKNKRTIKKYNYNVKTGEYSYYDENIYGDNGTTIT